MSIKTVVAQALDAAGKTYESIKVNKDADLNGLPATEVTVVTNTSGGTFEEIITVANKNALSDDSWAAIVNSYIKSRSS